MVRLPPKYNRPDMPQLKFIKTVVREVKKGLPPVVFFMVVFHIAMIIRHLNEISYGITTTRSLSATIAALMLGKLFLLLDDTKLMSAFRNKPLIFSSIWKTLLYTVLATIAFATEELIPEMIHAGTFSEVLKHRSAEFSKAGFLANYLFLAESVFIYCLASELVQAVGGSKVRTLFFGRKKIPILSKTH